MRKIILRGLCVLFLSTLCSEAFAGKVAFCEDDKDEL